MTIVIPAYNPDEKLVRLVRELTSRFSKVVVVDDGSTSGKAVFDEIAPIVHKVIRHEHNCGKGAAIKSALAFVGEDDVVTADADGQHAVDDIVKVASALERHQDGLVLGVRAFKGKMPLRSRFGNFWTRFFFRMAVGYSLSDTQTGLRGIPAKLTTRMRELAGERYEYEMAMLIDAKHHKALPLEIPIKMTYLADNETSHFSPLRDSIRIYRVMLFGKVR